MMCKLALTDDFMIVFVCVSVVNIGGNVVPVPNPVPLQTHGIALEEENILARLFADPRKHGRPYPDKSSITFVNVSTYFRSISSFDENKMEFTADMVLRQYWTDVRLRYDAVTTNSQQSNVSFITLTAEAIAQMWTPDIYFPTQRQGAHFKLTVPNMFCRVYPNGSVLFSVRYSITLSCDLNLKRYPFDEQHFVIMMTAYSSTNDALVFDWLKGAEVEIDNDFQLPKYKLMNATPIACSNEQTTGNYSCLKIGFTLEREIKHYIVETYLPTTLMVLVSWIGFWVDASQVSTRVSLCVLTMLTIVTIGSNAKKGLPPVSYIKGIDIWLGVCVGFVFLSLVEIGVVNYLVERNKDRLPNIHVPKWNLFRHRLLLKHSPMQQIQDYVSRIQFCRRNKQTVAPVLNSLAKPPKKKFFADDCLSIPVSAPYSVTEPVPDSNGNTAILAQHCVKSKQFEAQDTEAKDIKNDEAPPFVFSTETTLHERIDLIARVLFPVTFFIFCCLYFII